MKYWPHILTTALLVGCAHFKSQPLAPEKTTTELESRRLDDAGLKQFLEQNLGQQFQSWPKTNWDLDQLTLAAFYFQPSLEVARAQWHVALAGIKTAGGRPNPTLSVTPGFDTTTRIPSAWFPAVNLDLPFETAGKRGKRIAEANHLSESARWDIVTTAWKVRSDVRASLLDLSVAGRRAALLATQFAAQRQIVKLLQQRLDAGAISRPEFTTAQIALHKVQLDFSDAQSKESAARSHLAEALGVSAAALEGVNFQFDFPTLSDQKLTSAEARRAALLDRADIRSALADYAAAEDDLRLQIAQQYPDVHLNPGYQFDQGDNKWSIGLSFDLPVLNQNQGPIAEAKARRELAAAKFLHLQAQVIAEIDRAVAGWHVAEEQLKTGNELLAVEQQQQKSAQAQLEAGSADQLDSLNAQLEFDSASLTQLENESQLQQALGQLEDAMQSPLTLSGSIVDQVQKISREDKSPSKK